jgi:hypothetical protein
MEELRDVFKYSKSGVRHVDRGLAILDPYNVFRCCGIHKDTLIMGKKSRDENENQKPWRTLLNQSFTSAFGRNQN